MRHRHLITAIVMTGALALAGFAQAAECSERVSQLSDGSFLNLSNGHTGATCEAARDGGGSSVANTSAPLVIPTPPPVVSASTTEVSPPVPPPPVTIGLQDAVARARVLLEAHLKATAPKKPKTVASTNTWVDVTLAIWNATTNDVRLIDVQKNGERVRESDEASIAVARTNGINSEYVLDKGAGDDYVVGVEYPIFTKKKKVYELHDVVYVPYSEKLQVPEMVAWGKTTLDGYVADVLSELREKNIKSRAFPERLLADVIDPDLLKAIVFIEHSGISTMVNDPKGTTSAIQVVLGANQSSAYAYSVSTAGARGLVQFIPSTYKLIAKRQELGLIQDFVAGMSDPHNAIKAEAAYLDAEMAGMPTSIRALIDTDQKKLDTYLAAAYNGGGARVRKAIAAFGDAWSSDPSAVTAALQKQYDTLWAQADSLKKKILAEDNPKIWKPLQAQLNTSRANRAKVQAQITTLKASALHAETAGYLKKLTAVLTVLKPDSTTVALN